MRDLGEAEAPADAVTHYAEWLLGGGFIAREGGDLAGPARSFGVLSAPPAYPPGSSGRYRTVTKRGRWVPCG